MDQHITMMADMATNTIGMIAAEALDEETGDLMIGTNTITKGKEDGVIADHSLLTEEVEATIEVVDTREDVIQDLPAAIVEADSDGIGVGAAVVVHHGGDDRDHAVVREVKGGATTLRVEIEDVVGVRRGRVIEVLFRNHIAITTIAMKKQKTILPRIPLGKQTKLYPMTRANHRIILLEERVGNQSVMTRTITSHREINGGPVVEVVVAIVDQNIDDEMIRVMTEVVAEVDPEDTEARMMDIVAEVGSIIAHEGAIEDVAVILLLVQAQIMIHIHEKRGKEAVATPPENENAAVRKKVLPNTMIHVVRTTSKLPKMNRWLGRL